jgi:HAD superfamily hydrolase (TIGR01509 family)
MIRTLLFDFGRVISAPKPAHLFHLYEKELGLAPETINSIMFSSPLWQQALLGKIGMSAFWKAIGPQLNLTSQRQLTAFQQRYYQDEKINLTVLGLIKQLAKNHQLAIVSNHPPGLKRWLEDWHIDNLFDAVICSGDEGVAKPDSAIFLLALKRLGVTAPETIFIDDTKEHVLAARALGMNGHHFTSAAELQLDLKTYGILGHDSSNI